MSWLRQHKFEAHVAAFLLMMLSAAGLYLAARRGAHGAMLIGLALFALANLLAMVTR